MKTFIPCPKKTIILSAWTFPLRLGICSSQLQIELMVLTLKKRKRERKKRLKSVNRVWSWMNRVKNDQCFTLVIFCLGLIYTTIQFPMYKCFFLIETITLKIYSKEVSAYLKIQKHSDYIDLLLNASLIKRTVMLLIKGKNDTWV